MAKTEFSLTRFVAKYWLETTIGALAILILLVGIIISQTSHHGPADVASGIAQSALAVLPGKPTVTLDVLRVGGQMETFKKGVKIVITEGQNLEVSGWAIEESAKAAPSVAYLQVDQFARARSPLEARPDVAAMLKNPQYEKSGFNIVVPSALLPEGTHRLAFLLEDQNNAGYYVDPAWSTVVVQSRKLLLRTAHELPEPTAYALDEIVVARRPLSNASATPALATLDADEPVTLRGWAIDKLSGGVAGGVSAVIDGRKDVAGVYGSQRPDVASALGNDAFAPSGFLITIPAGSLSKGVHDVSLRIYTGNGSGYYLVKDRVKLTVE
jgi:hypothetical protein